MSDKPEIKLNLNQEKLLSDTDDNRRLNEYVQRLKIGMCGPKMLPNRATVARFLHLSYLLQDTPVILYDHPALIAHVDTAFTDGVNVCLAAPFVQWLLEDDKGSSIENQVTNGVAFVILHELSHIAMEHTARYAGHATRDADGNLVPRTLWNLAEDVVINRQNFDAFNESKPGSGLLKMAWGIGSWPEAGIQSDEEQAALFCGKTESEVLRKIMELLPMDNQQNQPGQQGQPGQPGQPGQQGGNYDARSKNAQKGIDEHGITPLELREELEKAGLKDIANKLGLPKTEEEQQAIQQRQQARVVQAASRAESDLADLDEKCRNEIAGAHVLDALQSRIRDLHEPVLSWRHALTDAVLGPDLGRDLYTEDVPGEIWSVDPDDIGISDPIYEGIHLPLNENERVTMVLVDTSGSVNNDMLRRFASEIKEIAKTSEGREIVLLSADTVLRGEPEIYTAQNVEQMIESAGIVLSGRGGTSITNCLCEALDLSKRRDWKVDTVVYFTDLCDTLPSRNDLPENLPRNITYITLEGESTSDRRKSVEEYAQIVEISAGTAVDLSTSTVQDEEDAWQWDASLATP